MSFDLNATRKGKVYTAYLEDGTVKKEEYDYTPEGYDDDFLDWKENFAYGIDHEELVYILEPKFFDLGFTSFLSITDSEYSTMSYACKKVKSLPKPAITLIKSFYDEYFNRIKNESNKDFFFDSLDSQLSSYLQINVTESEENKDLLDFITSLTFWDGGSMDKFHKYQVSKESFYAKNIDKMLHPLVDTVNIVTETFKDLTIDRLSIFIDTGITMDVGKNLDLGLYDFFIGVSPMYHFHWHADEETIPYTVGTYELALIAVAKYGDGVGIRRDPFYSRLVDITKNNGFSELEDYYEPVEDEEGNQIGYDLSGQLFAIDHSEYIVKYTDTIETLKQKDMERINSFKK